MAEEQQKAYVTEVVLPIVVSTDTQGSKPIRQFSLKLKGVTVEVCSIGASITKILLPNSTKKDEVDDIVLGYKTPLGMYQSGNPPFLGVIVGRVANRIQKGQFRLNDTEYKLAINNDPNHLHGGHQGFSTKIWNMKIVQEGVRCTLESPDGDQGYPGAVFVTVDYTLKANNNDSGNGVSLFVDMKAHLKEGGTLSTPINLAQHSYFNLSKHNDPQGILDHRLWLACDQYTPTDPTSIPTRQVVAVKDDVAMDLSQGKLMSEALQQFAVLKAGLEPEEAEKHITNAKSRCGDEVAKSGEGCPTPGEPYGFNHNYLVAKSGAGCPTPGEPYGFDHNYVVSDHNSGNADGLNLVATIEHEASKRRMKVYTNAPGVQVYTGNYLDGVSPVPAICKEGYAYGQWQGMCLETQHFPDSILTPEEEEQFPDFCKGKCIILRPGESSEYQHTVQYSFESLE